MITEPIQPVGDVEIILSYKNDKKETINFKNTVFFSFQPQFNYNLNSPGVSVGLMPIFKTSIVSIVDNENWIKQYPYNLSVNLFLRKRF